MKNWMFVLMTVLSISAWASDVTLDRAAAFQARDNLIQFLRAEVRAGRIMDLKYGVQISLCPENSNIYVKNEAVDCEELTALDLQDRGARFCLEVSYLPSATSDIRPMTALLNTADSTRLPNYQGFLVRIAQRPRPGWL